MSALRWMSPLRVDDRYGGHARSGRPGCDPDLSQSRVATYPTGLYVSTQLAAVATSDEGKPGRDFTNGECLFAVIAAHRDRSVTRFQTVPELVKSHELLDASVDE